MLLELKNDINIKSDSNNLKVKNGYIKALSTYSYSLVPNFIFENNLKDILDLTEIESKHDARDLEVNSLDLILCDPPYGFNTSENLDILTNLYSEFIEKAILALRPKGQLIICLPAESYTGRELPYCTRSDLVSRQIILKAHEKGRLVYQPAQSYPLRSLIPPYYWESERALRRIILHFYIY